MSTPELEWVKVESTNIAALAYDKKGQEAHVRFSSGGVGKYQQVSRQKFRAWLNAKSKGGYLNAHIKPVHTWVPGVTEFLKEHGKRCPKCDSNQISSNNTTPLQHRCLDCGHKFPDQDAVIANAKPAVAPKQPVKGSSTRGPVAVALRSAIQAKGSSVLYYIWAACGKPAKGSEKYKLYSSSLDVLAEVGSGKLDYKNLEKAIALAEERGL